MAVAVRSGSIATAASASAPKPPGLADGDLWVVASQRATSGTHNIPTGFTEIGSYQAAGPYLRVSYKVVTNAAGEPASVTATGAARTVSFAVSRASTSAPLNASDAGGSTSSTTTTRTVTTTVANCLLALLTATTIGRTPSSASTPLTPEASLGSIVIQMADGIAGAAGAYGPLSITLSSGSPTGSVLAAFAPLAAVLSGASAGSSSASATLKTASALAGSSAGGSSASANRLNMAHPLSGSVADGSSASAERLSLGHALSGLSDGLSTAMASLAVTSRIGGILRTSPALDVQVQRSAFVPPIAATRTPSDPEIAITRVTTDAGIALQRTQGEL
jgi:hypothetical protein